MFINGRRAVLAIIRVRSGRCLDDRLNIFMAIFANQRSIRARIRVRWAIRFMVLQLGLRRRSGSRSRRSNVGRLGHLSGRGLGHGSKETDGEGETKNKKRLHTANGS